MAAENSSSSSKSASATVDDKTLLKFYQKRFEDYQRKEDKYKEKIDKHLRNLVSDRHELEEEVLRRGEKISDLQKALVELQLSVFEERERFIKVSAENDELKRNEEHLHSNIRELLSMTSQKDLRDRIIYILKHPKVEVGYQTELPSKSKSSDIDISVNKKLKTELDYLQNQLNEVLKISRSKSDVVIEDCKQALEKSKEKIMQDELHIKELQRRLHDVSSQEKEIASKTSIASYKNVSVQTEASKSSIALSKSLSVQTEASKTSIPSKSLSVQTEASETSVPTKSLSIQTSASKASVPTKSLSVQTSASKTSVPTKCLSIQTEASKTSVPTKSLSIQTEASKTSVPTKSLSIQTSASKASVLTKSLSVQTEASKTSIPSKNLSVQTETSKFFIAPSKSLSVETAVSKSSSGSVHVSSSGSVHVSSSDSSLNLCSYLKDMHLSLILLLKIISKIDSILNSIQATRIYQSTANIPNVPLGMQDYVDESSITQLETYLRQCTRLTFDINNMLKSLIKYVANNKRKIHSINALKSELQHLENLLREMTVTTAETDLINVGLKRSGFFWVLKGTSDATEEDRTKHLDDFKKIISLLDVLNRTATRAADFVESVIHTYSYSDHRVKTPEAQLQSSTSIEFLRETAKNIPKKSHSEPASLKSCKSESSKDLENLLGIYRRTMEEAENLGFGLSAETKLLSEKLIATQKKLQQAEEELKKCDDNYKDEIMQTEQPQEELRPSNSEEILRKINKTLSKVEKMEQGQYVKDEQLCMQLAENVNNLTKKFKELTEEFSMKSVQEKFSEYSHLTLSKLEELAKQSRNSVIAAEAQIAAHRSNAKLLSEKLKSTEELLRESINECLSLKQKVKQTEDRREMDKYTFVSGLQEKLDKIPQAGELEDLISDLLSHATEDKSTKGTPFVCFTCQQGTGHKLCEEKIRDLRAEERKSRTMLKLLQQEMKEERMLRKHFQSLSEKSSAELVSKNNDMMENFKSLEARNTSLLEQLKLEKNRVKKMETFRRLEIEGFQTDIRNLKTKIRDMEKQLLKAVMIFENNNKDMELLKCVHETAQRSKQATSAIRRLKAKLYELENDIKNL